MSLLKKKCGLLLIIIIFLLIMIHLSGCEQIITPEENKFVGTWIGTLTTKDILRQEVYHTNVSVIFFSDGTLSWIYLENPTSGNYEIKDNKLTITSWLLNSIFDYSFSNNGTALTLVDVSTQLTSTFTKQ